jgi:hypothetical protein
LVKYLNPANSNNGSAGVPVAQEIYLLGKTFRRAGSRQGMLNDNDFEVRSKDGGGTLFEPLWRYARTGRNGRGLER